VCYAPGTHFRWYILHFEVFDLERLGMPKYLQIEVTDNVASRCDMLIVFHCHYVSVLFSFPYITIFVYDIAPT